MKFDAQPLLNNTEKNYYLNRKPFVGNRFVIMVAVSVCAYFLVPWAGLGNWILHLSPIHAVIQWNDENEVTKAICAFGSVGSTMIRGFWEMNPCVVIIALIFSLPFLAPLFFAAIMALVLVLGVGSAIGMGLSWLYGLNFLIPVFHAFYEAGIEIPQHLPEPEKVHEEANKYSQALMMNALVENVRELKDQQKELARAERRKRLR